MQNRYLSEIIELDQETDIEHHGVLGMKWGIRRYQPYSLIPRKSGKGGKETGTAKKGGSSKASSSSSKKSRNQKSAEAKAAVEKKAKTARQRAEELNKVVNSGDAKLVYEHRHELSKKQLDTAIERINTEARVASLVRQQNPTKLDKLKEFAGRVDDANSVVKTGVNAYKTVSEIKKLYNEASKARTDKEKAEVSAKVLREIIDNGNRDIDIMRLQNHLSKQDLQTATQRMSSMLAAEKSVQKRSERVNDVDTNASAANADGKTYRRNAREAYDKRMNSLSNEYYRELNRELDNREALAKKESKKKKK